MSSIHFIEEQKFRQWWIWIIVVIVLFIPIFTSWQLIKQSHPDALPVAIIGCTAPILVFIMLFSCKLKTEIDEYYISYRFVPFHFSAKKIYWEDVEHVYVTSYSPLRDFGGWGIRYSFRKGKAFNVSGNIGLQLILKNGKKILFGTQKKNALEDVMKILYSKKIVTT